MGGVPSACTVPSGEVCHSSAFQLLQSPPSSGLSFPVCWIEGGDRGLCPFASIRLCAFINVCFSSSPCLSSHVSDSLSIFISLLSLSLLSLYFSVSLFPSPLISLNVCISLPLCHFLLVCLFLRVSLWVLWPYFNVFLNVPIPLIIPFCTQPQLRSQETYPLT